MHLISALALIASCATLVSAGPVDGIQKRAISPDNTCGSTTVGNTTADGYTCPPALPCCSSHGYCGSTNAYCLTTVGCQAAFGNCTVPTPGTISPDFTCGLKGAGKEGYACPPEASCCSGAGYCGTTAAYCTVKAGCQSAYGTCNAVSNTSTITSTPGTSQDGTCGPTSGSCASNECCSLAGFCGTTADFCAAPDCQFQYGPACDANKTPSGSNTSSIARPKLGSVLYGSDGIYDCETIGDMALTFDDGPFIYTSHILDLLKTYNASATFFITGNNNGKGAIDDSTTAWPALIKRMYAEGHQIASHTWSHPDLCTITSAQRKNDMYKNEMAIRNILGFIPTYMRPPYSSCTVECGCADDMAELGYHVTYFDLDTSDYLNDSPALIGNALNLFDTALMGRSAATDDFLVIAHDIHNQTSEVLVEYMLKGIKSRGYRPVTVGDCLGDPKANWYRTDTSSTLGN